MTTKECLHAELETLSEDDIAALLSVARKFSRVPTAPKMQASTGLLDKLKKIAIDGPEDFASSLDQYHAQAMSVADDYASRPLITTDAVLTEIGNALAHGYKQEAIEIVEQFLTSGDVEAVRMTPELFAKAFALYRTRSDKEWGLTDCVSFVVMQDRGITAALTFDKHFVQAGFQPLLRDQNGVN